MATPTEFDTALHPSFRPDDDRPVESLTILLRKGLRMDDVGAAPHPENSNQ